MHRGYVLVVEDDAALGHIVVRELNKLVCAVYLTTGPAGAWGVVLREGKAPSLLISDIHLGSGDGRVLAAQLRQLYPGMPVLLMSGGIRAVDAPNLQGSGTHLFMEKPFTGDALRATVRDLLISGVSGDEGV